MRNAFPYPCLSDREVEQIPLLNLAYLGDTYFDLYVRTRLVSESKAASGRLQKAAVGKVRASGQARGLEAVLDSLHEDEKEWVRKGRNAHPHAYPKNASPAEYHMATALEVLLGVLYLTGRHERAWEIMRSVYESAE